MLRSLRTASLVVMLLVASFYLIENWRGAHAWKQAQARLAAAGESLDLESMRPLSVPPEKNFCATPALNGIGGEDEEALQQQLRLDGMDFFRHRSLTRPFVRQPRLDRNPMDLVVWRAFLYSSTALDLPADEPDPAKAMVLGFAPHVVLFDELIQAARDRPYAKFEPPLYRNDNRSGMLGPLEGNSPVGVLQNGVVLKARVCLAAGETEQAARLMHVLWRLHQAATNEPYRSVGLFASLWVFRSLTPVLLDGIRSRSWTDAHLVDWDRQLAALPLHQQSLEALRWEMADAVDFIERLLADQSSAMEEWSDNSRGIMSPAWEWALRLSPRGWLRQHQAFAANEFLDRILPPLRDAGLLAWHNSESLRRTQWQEGGHPPLIYSFMLGISMQPSPAALQCVFADIDSRQLRIACALERHYLRHQRYPEALAALMPDFLPDIPSDLDGKPIRYALDESSDRYRLWSVGINLVDDWNGQPPLEKRAKGRPRQPLPHEAADWVLSFPKGSR